MSMKGFNIDDYELVNEEAPASQGLKGLDLSEYEPVDGEPISNPASASPKKEPGWLSSIFGGLAAGGVGGTIEGAGGVTRAAEELTAQNAVAGMYKLGSMLFGQGYKYLNKGIDKVMGLEQPEDKYDSVKNFFDWAAQDVMDREVPGFMDSSIADLEEKMGLERGIVGKAIGQYGRRATDSLMPEGLEQGSAKYQVAGAMRSIGQMIPLIAASMLTRGKVNPLPYMAAESGGQDYAEKRDAGIDPSTALGAGILNTAAEYWTEKIPLGVLLNKEFSIGKRLLMEAATDIPGELVATTIEQGLIDTATTNPNKTWGEFLTDLKDTAIQSAIMAPTMGAAMHPIVKWAEKQEQRSLSHDIQNAVGMGGHIELSNDDLINVLRNAEDVAKALPDDEGLASAIDRMNDELKKRGVFAGDPLSLEIEQSMAELDREMGGEVQASTDLTTELRTEEEAQDQAHAVEKIEAPAAETTPTPTLLSPAEEIVKAREEAGDETTLQLGKEEETETAAKVLKVYPDKENNLEVHVAKVDKGYSVAIKDLDSGDFFDEVKIYPTEEEANKAAKAIAEGKKSPSVESKPEDTTKVSPEPEKTSQEATGVKPEEIKGEPQEEKQTAKEESAYEGENLEDLLSGVEREQTGRLSAIRDLEKAIKEADPVKQKKKVDQYKAELDNLKTVYEATYNEITDAGGDAAAMRTKIEGVVDNGEGMQETQGTEGQIKPATEEGATPVTPPKKPAKAAPSSPKKKQEPQAELRKITTRRKEPADPAVLDAFKKALADPSEENMEALVAHAKRFEEWQYDEKGKKRKNVGYRKFKEALGEIPGVSYPEWKTLGSQSATDFWNGIRFVPGVKPTTTPLGEEFIPESEIDSIIKTADNNIQGIKEELYEDGYSESEVKEIVEGLTKELESEVSGRTTEEILAELKEAVKAARIEVEQPTEETKTETPEPEDGWRDHLIKARKYALDLGITKEQVSNWNSVESIVEAVDKRLSGEETTKDPNRKLVKAFKDVIDKGQPKDKNAVLKVAAEALGIDQGKAREELNQRYREIEEAYEYALVQKAGEIAKDGSLSSGEKFEQIKRLYDEQPLLLERTSTSTEKQQFSTPLPLAYLMSEATGITTNSKVADLAGAGNGALLIGTNPKNATANELDTGSRSEHLKESGYTVLNYDAREDVPDNLKKSQDVIVINPPFKAMEPVEYDGYRIGKLEHLLALKSLEAMKDDGRAAIIIGGHNFKDGKKMITADRTFFNYLYSRYNVRYNVDIDGEVYRRQGTTFPIRLLVVDGRKTTVDPDAFAPTRAEQVQSAGTFDEVREVLGGNALSMASQEAEGIRQTEREGNVPEGVGEGGTERVDRPEGQRDQDNERDRGHDTSGREGPLPGDGGSGEEGLRPDNVPGGHESPGINIFDASKKEELRKKILEKLGKTEKGKKAPDELFDTSGQFTLSGNQPTTEPKKMTVPEKKGERLLDVEKQDVDQLRDRLTEGQKAPQKPVKIFDESKKDELKKRIKERLNRQSMNPILDPGLYVDAVHLGGIYVQEGLNNFAAWSKQMVKDLGEAVNPMLKSVWATLTHYPTQHKKDFVRLHGATKGSLFWTTDLKKALSRQIGKFSASTGVKIEIIQNNYGFPRDFIERAGGSLDVENDVIRGAYDSRTNTVYIVADGIDSVKMAEHVIIEEIVGHKGLKALLKPLEMSMVRLSVYDQFKDTPMMRELAREYGFDTDTLTGRAMAGNEFMVHHMPSIYEKPTIMNKLTSFIRRALRKIGFTVQYSEADIRVLMNRAWENMRGDKAQLKGEGGIFFHINAFHGGPFRFDRFSTDRIGTGEGAQVFGWGLYFTDKEDIARYYAQKLGDNSDLQVWKIGGKRVTSDEVEFDTILNALANGRSKERIIADWQERIRLWEEQLNTREDILDNPFRNDRAIQEAIEAGKRAIEFAESITEPVAHVHETNRNLYTVTLHKGKAPGEYRYMDWDKPIGKGIAKVLRSALPEDFIERYEEADSWAFRGGPVEMWTGEEAYRVLEIYAEENPLPGDTSDGGNPQKEASLFLLRNGIDGIRYPSGSLSGNKGDGLNYVVFDENAVTIEDSISFRKKVSANGMKTTFGRAKVASDNGETTISALLKKIEKADYGKKDNLFLSVYGADRNLLLQEMVLRLPDGTYLLSTEGKASPSLQRTITDKYGPQAGADITEKFIRGLASSYPQSVSASLTLGLEEVRLSNALSNEASPSEGEGPISFSKDIPEDISVANKVFNEKNADAPIVQMMLENPEYYRSAKGKEIILSWMSPSEYLDLSARIKGTTVHREISTSDARRTGRYEREMKRLMQGKGERKFPALWVEEARGDQEGRHRAIAALQAGIKLLPVYQITDVSDISFRKGIKVSPELQKDLDRNSEKAASPEEAYHKSKSFKERLKESLGSDIGWFVKHFYNPFFKGQKIPAWKRAVDISENRRENRTELNHQYFGMSRDFYGLQGESLRKLEKVLIEGDATLPYKHADMLKEAAVLKEGGNLEGAKEMREKARQLRALNRYSDEELKEGVTVDGGEKIILSDKEIEIYKSIRSMFDRMHNDWYVNQMNLLLRRYANEPWFEPFVEIYSQRDTTPEMAKLWKTINRFAFNNYKGKKDKTIQKKRQADIAVLADHFGDTITAADLVNMAKAYRDNISTMNQIRKARNRLGKWIAYFPRVRGKGKYYLNVYEVTKDVNEETGEETERRSLIFNTTFRNAQEGEKLEKEILSELKGTNVTVELGEVKRESEQSFVGASDMNLQRLLDNAISRMKGAKGVDPDTLKSIKGSMIQAISNELKARGFAQHSIRRKWKLIKGYETTGLQKVLRDYITGFTGMSTKQEAAIDFLDLMQTIDRKQTNLYEDISKYARDMLRNQEALDRISGKARGYAFIWYLGANIRPMLLQLTQNYVTGMPFLKEKMREWGVKGASEKLYHKAMIDAARTKIDSTTGEVKGKALNKWEKQMIKEMLAKGIAEDQYIQEITGQMRSKVGRAYDKALYYLSYPFSQMEIFNRKSAGLAMFRIAWDRYSDTIKNEEDRYRKAFEEAKEYIYKTHYAYGKENLPRIATGGDVASIGSRTALTFRSFTHNYLLSLINSGDWKTIAHSLAYVAIFGGLLGLPLIGDILDLLEKWTGKSYKKSAREVLRKFGGRTLETFGMHGLPALAGANISGSMAIGIPFVGETPADTVYGVMGGLAQKGKLAVQSLGRGDVYRALENAAPEFVANPMKAYRMATTGATTQRGKRLFDEHGRPVKLSASEAAIKTVGFNPSEYSAKNEAQRSASNIQEYFSDWKTNIYESYRVARLNHNVKAQNDAMKDIRKFNQAVREKGAQDLVSLIKLSNVVKAARERQTKKQRRESRFKRDYVGG